MGRSAFVTLVDDQFTEHSNVADWFTTEDGFVGLENDKGEDIVVFNKAHVKLIAFRDTKPEPPTDYALGHKDDKNTGLSAGDRAVVLLPGHQWYGMTVDVIGPYKSDSSDTRGSAYYAIKFRGEVPVRVLRSDFLRPVPEERRNDSR